MNSEFEGPPKNWPPLGLPIGSVRALLTLIVVAVVVSRTARGLPVDALWTQTLLIALAHYFTARRFVSLPPDVLARLEEDGLIERERHPLFLPRNTIRALIVLAFIGLAVFLYREQRLFQTEAMSLLCLIFAYLLGSLTRTVGGWIHRQRSRPPTGTWGDIKALIVLLTLIAAAIPEFLVQPIQVPEIFEQVALGLMLFYYGSR